MMNHVVEASAKVSVVGDPHYQSANNTTNMFADSKIYGESGYQGSI